MKRPFVPSSASEAEVEEDRSSSVGALLTRDSEVCCDPQGNGVVQTEHPGPDGSAMPCSDHSRPKRERKQRSYTLCAVCNIQLNSPAQAQIHYNGKSHQKRLKQASSGPGQVQLGSTGITSRATGLLCLDAHAATCLHQRCVNMIPPPAHQNQPRAFLSLTIWISH
ncbi:hypothetical protein DPEC_G00277530 [Dallia pectoralis]|uniref:Uncharacterized protein n=1 Tax=Dallia pectoralis TaxID=75939 RepID=A0ACC2FLZ1_DALPE|nr:hypothetical protein DPEC_G00277530 [Dallia pectoralis]